jgi:hypothetical protein
LLPRAYAPNASASFAPSPARPASVRPAYTVAVTRGLAWRASAAASRSVSPAASATATHAGKLRTYKIHLGSSDVLMEPNDKYLCTVPARPTGQRRVYLPFPDDDRFSVILSKAFLLAADDKIADKSITTQIHR